MKKSLVSDGARRWACGSAVLLCIVFAGASVFAQERGPADVVADVVEAYYEAAADGDMATARNLTHIDAKLFGARNDKLTAELQRTRLALEITGKAHALLELLSESADTERRSTK